MKSSILSSTTNGNGSTGTGTGTGPAAAISRRSLVLFFTSSSSALAVATTTTSPAADASPFASAGRDRGQLKIPFSSSTPYSQSKQALQLGLDNNGRIRACPSTNPGCVSTNPTVGASCSFASPLLITLRDKTAAVAALRQAIVKTQRNAVIKADEDTPYGHYIQAEVDGGGLGRRDVMEFLVKTQQQQRQQQEQQLLAAYRCVATKVTFLYPFTTAVGDSKGQTQRIDAISRELGWYAPDMGFDLADEDDFKFIP